MKLHVRNGRYVLHIAPNFAIHVPKRAIRPLDSKYTLVYVFDDGPILAELQ
jgi:hypothetical protein